MSESISSGPDPDFPYLSAYDRYTFPTPDEYMGDIVAVGGNLSPGMLLSAYENGIFPWYNPEDPIIWQSPNPRMVLFPEELHCSSSMKKVLKKGLFSFALDKNFPAVIKNCADAYRPSQIGTWITNDIIKGYTEMHKLGWAHSAEAYDESGELAGGCYGIRLGKVFFGESMFSRKPNASKAAFLYLANLLFSDGISFIDCQAYTDHLASLGAREISRRDFLKLLKKALACRKHRDTVDAEDRRGDWSFIYADYEFAF